MKTKNLEERAKLAEALLNGASREKLILSLMKTYCGKSSGLGYSRLNDTWFDNPEYSIFDNLVALNEDFAQLSLDFGFMTHLPEFLDIIRKQNPSLRGYEEARDFLKQALGYKELWRGMLLSEREVEEIRKNGIKSKLFLSESDHKTIEKFEEQLERPNCIIDKHFCREVGFSSPFISLTAHRDLALAVAKKYGDHSIKSLTDWKNVYLFKVKVPEIDIIYFTEHGLRKPSYFEKFREGFPKVVVYKDGNENVIELDRDGECLIHFKINPEEIVQIEKPEDENIKLR